MSRSLSSAFPEYKRDRPLCFGAYVDKVLDCQYCAWKKECMEA